MVTPTADETRVKTRIATAIMALPAQAAVAVEPVVATAFVEQKDRR
jgi:hypothetical protein